MPHETALLATIAAGLGLAFVFGFLATRVRLPPLVGYLVAGIVVGPFTPGYVADTGLASQLAEVGVILLMFGVGLHFSVRDLLAVRRIAVPGALVRIVVITVIGTAIGRWWGWSLGGALVFGLSLSVASTVVLLRAFEGRGILTTTDGRIAVGWLIVEDLAMVLVLVLLPPLAGLLGGSSGASSSGTALVWSVGLTLLKVAAFVGIMLYAGSRVVPWLLGAVARTGSRELFTLSVLAAAVGIAFGAAALFGVSFALGAFFAGVVISESDLSHQAAAEALPLQDAFAVLFFVSVGMVFDPRVLVREPLAVLATLLVAMVAKAVVSLVIVLVRRYPLHTALTVSAGLAQIGEFSFILAGLGRSLGLLPKEGQSLILASAILSITLNPFAFWLLHRLGEWIASRPRLLSVLEREGGALGEVPESIDESALRDHAVIVGFGRVGGTIGRALAAQGIPYIVVEYDREWVESLRARGVPVLFGNATRPGILEHAHVAQARILVIAAPGVFQAREILVRARRLNPTIDVVVRTHSEAEQAYLEEQGVGLAVMGERELALGMTRYALHRCGLEPDDVEIAVEELRSPAATPAAPV
jgi:K+:H+ antiporter